MRKTIFPTSPENFLSNNSCNLLNFDIFKKQNSIKQSDLAEIFHIVNKIHGNHKGNYIYHQFCNWFADYINKKPDIINHYFSGDKCLNFACQDFIKFCFSKSISLDATKTLLSLKKHDQLADNAIREKIREILPRKSINLMGFGLGNGYYEKSLSDYILANQIAKKVNLSGFDPYSTEENGIKLVTENELLGHKPPKFDIIIARWVLHHVDYKYRWQHLISCIKSMNQSGIVLIVEHGFLGDNELKNLPITSKLYKLINACFDVVTNIGIRPHWFTSTSKLGSNFFIGYLTSEDFKTIRKNAACIINEEVRHLGPDFPNQTFYCFGT